MSDKKPWYKRPIFIGLGVVIAIGLIILGVGIYNSRNDTNTSAASSSAQAQYKYELASDGSSRRDELGSNAVNTGRLRQLIQESANKPVSTTELDKQINAILSQNSDITFGVSIIDLSTDSTHNYGSQAAMTAASITKVITAVYYLHQVELDSRSLSTVMANGATAEQNMEQMIVLSDNEAWHILNENLGYQQLQDYAHSIGLASYRYSDNVISSADTAKLFGGLYKRKLINESNTELLLSYLERANYREFIIPAVPEADTVYHKVGFYSQNINDAAIITNSTEAIVLSIFTKSSAYPDQNRVASLMQQITTPTLANFSLN